MRTPRWFARFIAAIEGGASVTVACQLGPVSTSYVHRLRRRAEQDGEDAPATAKWFAGEWSAAEQRRDEKGRRSGAIGIG